MKWYRSQCAKFLARNSEMQTAILLLSNRKLIHGKRQIMKYKVNCVCTAQTKLDEAEKEILPNHFRLLNGEGRERESQCQWKRE